jgi:putative hydrolase of the HAD superfamily
MKPTLIIDADDTLWENNIFYEECIANFAELMATLGFDQEEAEHTLDEIERERVLRVGYAPQEFARSMVITYERLCEKYDRPVDDEVSGQALEIGRAVMGYPIVLLEGVKETLGWLSERFRLLLLTKGDQAAQEDKVARSSLSRFFGAVHVVPEKDAQVFRDLITEYGLKSEQTWMVGNSPKSDINPAVEAGIGAIYVPHSNTWTLEVVEITVPEQVIVLKRFGDLVTLFENKE